MENQSTEIDHLSCVTDRQS
jgi:hypothetical protein